MNEEVARLPIEKGDRILELPNFYWEKGIEIGRENEREKVVQNMLKKRSIH